MKEEIPPKETSEKELMPKPIDYSNIDLFNADFSFKKLRGYNFSFSRLKLANFKGSDLSHTKFIGTDLYRANFQNTILYDAVFKDANLSRADFRGAKLYGIRLIGADLTRTIFDKIITEEKNAKTPEDFSRAAEVYSILKRAYKESHQLTQAGYYYYREMYCRTRSEKNLPKKVLKILFLEKIFGYGEKISKPIITSIFIITLFSLLFYRYSAHFDSENKLIIAVSNSQNPVYIYLYALLYSIAVFFQIPLPNVTPSGICVLFFIAERMLGFVMNSIILSILVRKIIRY